MPLLSLPVAFFCSFFAETPQDETRNENNVFLMGGGACQQRRRAPFVQLKRQVRIRTDPKRTRSPPPPPLTSDLVSLTDVRRNMMQTDVPRMLSKHSLLSFLWNFKEA